MDLPKISGQTFLVEWATGSKWFDCASDAESFMESDEQHGQDQQLYEFQLSRVPRWWRPAGVNEAQLNA